MGSRNCVRLVSSRESPPDGLGASRAGCGGGGTHLGEGARREGACGCAEGVAGQDERRAIAMVEHRAKQPIDAWGSRIRLWARLAQIVEGAFKLLQPLRKHGISVRRVLLIPVVTPRRFELDGLARGRHRVAAGPILVFKRDHNVAERGEIPT